MSVDEDVELRDLVSQTLESNGCLAKIRAELRASIFLALDEDQKVSNQQPLLNNRIKTYLETPEGKAMFCIVREFLEFFNLLFTISVYDPESYLGTSYQYEGRHKIVKDLGLEHLDDTTVPLLMQLIKIAQKKTKIDINLNVNSAAESVNHNNNSSSIHTKTETNSNSLNTKLNLNENAFVEENNIENKENLNATFNLSQPTTNLLHNQTNNSNIEINHNKKVNNIDEDTYEDTSSIAEDSVALANSENSGKAPERSSSNGIPTISVLDDGKAVSNETKSIVKQVSKVDLEKKPKSPPQKPEIMKSKNSLSSLSDLPPLQLNKSKVSDILPSLYSKEFKEKSNLKELDKMFDMEADYEEDFIYSGDELSLGLLGPSKLNTSSDESFTSDNSSSEKSSVSNKLELGCTNTKTISDCVKPVLKSLNPQRGSFKENHRGTSDKT